MNDRKVFGSTEEMIVVSGEDDDNEKLALGDK
jgi:hypothetical protein